MKTQVYTATKGWYYQQQGPGRPTVGRGRTGPPRASEGPGTNPDAPSDVMRGMGGVPYGLGGDQNPLSPALGGALAQLSEARRTEPRPTPCEGSPERWEQPEVNGLQDHIGYLARVVSKTMQECNSCAVFTKCQGVFKALDPANPEIQGVLAGEYVGTRDIDGKIQKALKEMENAQ